MAETVYLLCAGMSALCAFLLLRGFGESRARLLFWSGLCFVGLAMNNLLLFVDLIVVPDTDLAVLRSVTALASIAVLLGGLIWESR
jgi:hypothetical protein